MYPLLWGLLRGRLCLSMGLLGFRYVRLKIMVRDPLYHTGALATEVATRYLGGEETGTSVSSITLNRGLRRGRAIL